VLRQLLRLEPPRHAPAGHTAAGRTRGPRPCGAHARGRRERDPHWRCHRVHRAGPRGRRRRRAPLGARRAAHILSEAGRARVDAAPRRV